MAAAPQLIQPATIVEKHLRRAALLTCLGLLTLLLTLIHVHPLAFVAFALIACPLTLAGILRFLFAIVSQQPGSIEYFDSLEWQQRLKPQTSKSDSCGMSKDMP